MSFGRFLGGWLVALGTFCGAAAMAAPVTTAPSRTGIGSTSGGYRQNPVMLVQRFRTALGQMNLSDDQKAKVQLLLDKADGQARIMQPDLAAMRPPERLQKMLAWLQEITGGLGQILTPDQLQEFRQKVGTLSGPLVTLNRLQSVLGQLNLSDDQKKQVQSLLAEVRQRAPELRQAMQNGQDISAQLQEINAQIRQRLGDILTADQRQQLQTIAPALGDLPGQLPSPPKVTAAAPPAATAPLPAIVDPQARARLAAKSAAIAAAPPSPQGAAPTNGQVGSAAPDFSLGTLDNRTISLSQLKGRTVVLEFGSYTCPAFRDRAAAMDRVRRQFSGRVTFLVIYTREAYPKGEWDVQRNQDAGIAIAQPTDLITRRQTARTAVTSLRLMMPVAVDSMDDAVAKAYGGMPNATVVIDATGKIAARQRWTDPSGLPDLIEAALAHPATQPAAGG